MFFLDKMCRVMRHDGKLLIFCKAPTLDEWTSYLRRKLRALPPSNSNALHNEGVERAEVKLGWFGSGNKLTGQLSLWRLGRSYGFGRRLATFLGCWRELLVRLLRLHGFATL